MKTVHLKDEIEMEKWDDIKKEIKSITEEEKTYLELLADIVTIREDKNLTQREISELTGLKQPAIARLESPAGQQNGANILTIIKYLDALGMKLKIVTKEGK
jgi:predicted XRE-type DNA-binding protein